MIAARLHHVVGDSNAVRFDDSLSTVLSADAAPGAGAQATWRQLVDLMGRGRIADDEPVIARLRILREVVPLPVRAASARALAFAAPPARLVGFFAEDDLPVAAAVLRTATLPADAWLALLGRFSPAGRSILRGRRDLPAEVLRGLESFGTTDFALADERPPAAVSPAAVSPAAASPADLPVTPDAPLGETPFVSLGAVARSLPVVAEALRRAEPAADPAPAAAGGFVIADLVARIDAFNRRRTEPEAPPAPIAGFRFESDAAGIVRWVEGISRTPLIGVSLEYAARQGVAQLDATVAGAFRRRTEFADARLEVEGSSDAAGSWRVSAVPVFDRDSGRFTGFRGSARRPRLDEVAARAGLARAQASDSLRQLVHELRTPTNAIAGFAELIESELLGAVAEPYRGRAAAIRAQAGDLLAAIDDLDTAARIDGDALELRPTAIPFAPLLARVVEDLGPLARLRGTVVSVDAVQADAVVLGDDRAVERLVARLLAALVSAGGRGERLALRVLGDEIGTVMLVTDRPAALAAYVGDELLAFDAEREADVSGAPLLGTGFALRLAQNLAAELGGSLSIAADRLALRLPAAEGRVAGQATSS